MKSFKSVNLPLRYSNICFLFQEDEALLKQTDLSDNMLFILQLRRNEKIILQSAVKFAAERKCNIVKNSQDPSKTTDSKDESVETS